MRSSFTNFFKHLMPNRQGSPTATNRISHDALKFCFDLAEQHYDAEKTRQEVIQNQINGGYAVDKWELKSFEELDNVWLQSLITPDYLVTLPAGALTSDEGFIAAYEDFLKKSQTGQLHFPRGTSQFYADAAAYTGYIHDQWKKPVVHFHHKTQVSKVYCPHTGIIQFPLRSLMAVFPIQSIVPDIQKWLVPYSIVRNNVTKKLQLTDGSEKVVNLGTGGVPQIYLDATLMPLFNMTCKMIVSQKPEGFGIMRKNADGVWQLDESKIATANDIIALPAETGTPPSPKLR